MLGFTSSNTLRYALVTHEPTMNAHLLLVLPLLLPACHSTAGEGPNDPGPRSAPLLHGIDCGLSAQGIHVARTPAEWRTLWDALTRNRLPKPPAPSIDWEHDMVVCVTLGTRPSGGYTIELEGLRIVGSELVVDARERRPAADAIVPMVTTAPYALITTERRAGAVTLALK